MRCGVESCHEAPAVAALAEEWLDQLLALQELSLHADPPQLVPPEPAESQHWGFANHASPTRVAVAPILAVVRI